MTRYREYGVDRDPELDDDADEYDFDPNIGVPGPTWLAAIAHLALVVVAAGVAALPVALVVAWLT